MDDPDLEPESGGRPRSVLDTVDRLVTTLCLAALGVVTTFALLVARPASFKREFERAPETEADPFRLPPGAFLLAAFVAAFAIAGATNQFVTAMNWGPQPSNDNYGAAVREALASGDIWQTVSLLVPLAAISLAVAGAVHLAAAVFRLKPRVRRSLGAAFYLTGFALLWVIGFRLAALLVGAALGADFRTAETASAGLMVFSFLLIVFPWATWGLLRAAFDARPAPAAGAAAVLAAALLGAVVTLGLLISNAEI